MLWSSSLDATIRVWDLNSMKCVGILNSTSNGHNAAVSAMVLIPPPINQNINAIGLQTLTPPPTHTGYMASGSMDGEVRLWSLNGELLWTGTHVTEETPGVGVTALHVFQDLLGGK